MSGERHEQRVYDHRLRQLVRDTGDIRVATEIGVPRSTAAGWLRAEPQDVVTLDLLGMRKTELQLELVKLRRRVLVLAMVVRLLLALVRLSGVKLDARSLHKDAMAALLSTIERARKVLQLRSVLRILGLSSARYHSWTQPDADCHPADVASCPRRVPNQLTAKDVSTIKDMVTSQELAFRVGDHFDVGNAIAVLMDAVRNAEGNKDAGAHVTPMLMVDGGIENFNSRVDELVASGMLRRVLAQTEVSFSNSLIEAFWRTMKHQWLFLNTLDSVAAVRRHVTFYIAAHNGEIPHAAFRGQTPDEMYFGRGTDLPDRLAAAKKEARAARLAANREASCASCSGHLNPVKSAPDPAREAVAA